MTWQPKVGEYARTRDGRKAWVAIDMPANPFNTLLDSPYPLRGYIDGDSGIWKWEKNGMRPGLAFPEAALVGPWQEPVDVPVTVFIDLAGNRLCGSGHYTPSRSDVVGYKHATVRVAPGDKG